MVEQAVRLENATGTSGSEARPARIASGDQFAQRPAANLDSISRPDQIEIDRRVAGGIVRGLTAMVNQHGGSMTMRLDPPDLGQLRVQMVVHQAVVTAEFHASTTQAQAILQKHIAMLRSSLESQGLSVDRLTVHAPPANGQSTAAGGDGAAPDQQDQGEEQRDAGKGQSRGRRDGAGERGAEQRFPDPADFAALVEGLEQVSSVDASDGVTTP